MIYCNECKQMVPAFGQHTCPQKAGILTGVFKHCVDCNCLMFVSDDARKIRCDACVAAEKARQFKSRKEEPVPERNYGVIGAKDQSQSPRVDWFADKRAALEHAKELTRNTHSGHDVFEVRRLYNVLPSAPQVKQLFIEVE
jgi:hypothetical protein